MLVDVPYVMIPVPFAALSERDPSEAHLSDSVAGYTDTSAPELARNSRHVSRFLIESVFV